MFGFKQVWSSLTATDHKIKSNEILGIMILATFIIQVALFIAEVALDLKSTSSFILLPFLALNIILGIAFLLNVSMRFLGICLVVLHYSVIEVHSLLLPTAFHTTIYWFAIIPVIALIIGGIRLSQSFLVLVIVSIILNAESTRWNIGDTYPISISLRPFIASGIIFSISIYSGIYLLYKLLGDAYKKMREKSNDLEQLQTITDKGKLQLEKYQKGLFTLSKDPAVTEGNLEILYEKLCKLTSENLQVNRVSIWSYEANPPSIHRKYLYELDGSTDELFVLEKNQFPGYFRAMLTKNFIAAENARYHPDTAEFKDSYLVPLDIHSMLDCPISIDGKFMGVVCCENQHQQRNWSPEDILFVQSLSDIIAIGSKTNQINQLLKQIRNQNHELIEQRNEIKTLNEELSATNEELLTMNESLDVSVKSRTKELEQQNEQLTEYAFINSHLLRAPLARILGLSYLISKNKDGPNDPKIIEALLQSTDELDAITRRISELLYVGSNFSREEIKEIIDRNLTEPE